jgi:hypothetical protein
MFGPARLMAIAAAKTLRIARLVLGWPESDTPPSLVRPGRSQLLLEYLFIVNPLYLCIYIYQYMSLVDIVPWYNITQSFVIVPAVPRGTAILP